MEPIDLCVCECMRLTLFTHFAIEKPICTFYFCCWWLELFHLNHAVLHSTHCKLFQFFLLYKFNECVCVRYVCAAKAMRKKSNSVIKAHRRLNMQRMWMCARVLSRLANESHYRD